MRTRNEGASFTSTRSTLAAIVLAAFALPAAAADKPGSPLNLVQAIELVAKTYPGRPISAQSDPVGGEGLHHHVDVMLPGARVAKFDVDARSHRIYNRLPPESGGEEKVSLVDAVKKVEAQTKGKVLSAEYDPDPRTHYHMNVRAPGGKLERYDFDLETGKVAPHKPRS